MKFFDAKFSISVHPAIPYEGLVKFKCDPVWQKGAYNPKIQVFLNSLYLHFCVSYNISGWRYIERFKLLSQSHRRLIHNISCYTYSLSIHQSTLQSIVGTLVQVQQVPRYFTQWLSLYYMYGSETVSVLHYKIKPQEMCKSPHPYTLPYSG